MLSVLVAVDGQTLSGANVYAAPQKHATKELEKALSEFKAKWPQVVIVGDLNARHELWEKPRIAEIGSQPASAREVIYFTVNHH